MMDREKLLNLPLGHDQNLNEMRDTFASIGGGIGLPAERPGFAVVAGVLHPASRDTIEIHVLDETESTDLDELLRRCRGLARKWDIHSVKEDQPFDWYGDAENVAAARTVAKLNQEGEHAAYGRDCLVLHRTAVVDMGADAMSHCFSVVRSLTLDGRKSLFLHGSRVAHYMSELLPEDVPGLSYRAVPSAFALAAVVTHLHDEALALLREREQPAKSASPYGNWARFNRGRRR